MTKPITNADKLAELKRERGQRERVYPRLIDGGGLSREKAARQIEVLDACIADYEARADEDRRAGDLFGGRP